MADNTQTVRYAPYIETRHTDFLTTVYNNRVASISASPFANYTAMDISDAFFGIGYVISDYTSLFELFNSHMLNLDTEGLYNQIFADTVDSAAVANLIAAEGALMRDEIDTNVIPRVLTGSRDINAVMASSFIIGKSLIEDSRVKLLTKFGAELKYRLIPIASERWTTTLNWNKNMVGTYAELMKFYFSAYMDINGQNYEMAAKNALWPFTILDFEKAALGAMQGAVSTVTGGEVAGSSSKAQKVLGSALSGAALGAMVGKEIGGQMLGYSSTTWGAGIGGILGAAASFL